MNREQRVTALLRAANVDPNHVLQSVSFSIPPNGTRNDSNRYREMTGRDWAEQIVDGHLWPTLERC